MSRIGIVICPRMGEEAVLLPGGAVRSCEFCGQAVRVTHASLSLGRHLMCTPCAQAADVVPRSELTPEQRAELARLGYSEAEIESAVRGGLHAYHAGRRS